jgi:hypothetical protein
MAKAAAPYQHRQLHAVAHKYLNADGSPIAPVAAIVADIRRDEPDTLAIKPRRRSTSGASRHPRALDGTRRL